MIHCISETLMYYLWLPPAARQLSLAHKLEKGENQGERVLLGRGGPKRYYVTGWARACTHTSVATLAMQFIDVFDMPVTNLHLVPEFCLIHFNV